MLSDYCKDLARYQRRDSTEVIIGGIPLGAGHPIRIQSMTNSATSDVAATTDQITGLQKSGADYVRLTIPSLKDVESLKQIMSALRKKNCNVPVIADIHFNPAIAIACAGIVHKVRINPGNFTDKVLSNLPEYTSEVYQQEYEKARLQFIELIAICRANHTALRIGTNHGSLSGRIMSRFGDTPEGMAESAMEFLRICRQEHFDQVVVSMKASNTRTMVYATRLLVKKMDEENMHFPLHLGVTEAGEGEDGRIRSAIGIGALLADGLGDTIRVSLTEDPIAEIPVAAKLVSYFRDRKNSPSVPEFGDYPVNPFEFLKRLSRVTGTFGGSNPVAVIKIVEGLPDIEKLAECGWNYLPGSGWNFTDQAADMLQVDSWSENLPYPTDKYLLIPYRKNIVLAHPQVVILIAWEEYFSVQALPDAVRCIRITASELDQSKIERISKDEQAVVVLETNHPNGFADQRAAICRMINLGCRVPVLLKREYAENEIEDLQLKAACDLGGLFIDGLGEGIWLENQGTINNGEIVRTAFGILQFSRMRISKTEYISCPSCGRTQFDLQTTIRKIREKTAHLKGLKIGIMGCIVNGPGEMADADYGYVGAGKGKVSLYKEKNVVKRNVTEERAVDELVQLIKENGDWIEP
jgi:(E)-4-hydroxy-3-methylbut-2-enyl-diphosphate synthase